MKAVIGPNSAVGRRAVLGGLAALAVGVRPARAAELGPILIVPLGAAPTAEVGIVQRAAQCFFALEVRVAARERLAASAFYAPRSRYRAERLLTQLERPEYASAHRVLGLANVDISTTKGSIEDWGVLGLASLDGRVGVLSSFRCRRGATGPEHVAQRLGKTAVHELGHTFGLDHCGQFGCLMGDGQGSVFTTDREFDFCSECRARLKRRGLASARAHSRPPPWPSLMGAPL